MHADERPTQIFDLGFADEAAHVPHHGVPHHGDDAHDGYYDDVGGYDEGARGGAGHDDRDPTRSDDDYFDDSDYDDYDDYYYDDGEEDDRDGDRAEPAYILGDDGDDPPPTERRRGRRAFRWLAALVVLALLAGGAYFGARELLGFGYEDYEGSGDTDVLLHVEQGDSTRTIASKLDKIDVVASADAFLDAAEDDQRVLAVQPGYYVVKTKASGASAVETLVGPEAQVGQAEIRAGTRLADRGGDSPQPGVLSQLSEASCADLNGESTCVSVEDMRSEMQSTDLTELGVPEWAAEPAQQRAPEHRLEGLITPGIYDIRPGWDARKLLTEVLTTSATRLEAAGLPDAAEGSGHTPYEVLIIASIVQVEGVQQDFGKIARVIENRLREGMPLEMDSSINFALESPTIRTKREARDKDGPHNTYTRRGLPATPLGAPSTEAISAAESPQEGPWKYFVLCEENGLSCFSQSYPEHKRAVGEAQRKGVY
ncbi:MULTISPECIES: endolytic transglycosylase MltG [Prauserella salsuginis group]|uniref:Endolytic murein transglycosylase n=1 Tax=Prauserella salsuginis TaxID=387889 RepID=A0ABW6GAD7_9PSEU|nr:MULTISPECIES: endolytic transglycosylase MltG [Prauserella salsuginis group]MCR3723123.1 UPF0755 protein [Prauserella flava]MCR3732502.1 UPF0755 protein [Prauserella salsuginis]